MAAKTTSGPKVSRPSMSGYGVPASMKGSVPWTRAQKRFADTHNYWLTSVRPDGRPSSSAVWGVWLDGKFWFSCAPDSRKARNLAKNAACTVTTDQANEAVILEGVAEPVHGRARLLPMVRVYQKKYDWKMDPEGEGYFIVHPRVAFVFHEGADDFAASATRYTFAGLARAAKRAGGTRRR